ncbi:hypothetical protein JCM10212_005033 [Sporobolomyces blumeae]
MMRRRSLSYESDARPFALSAVADQSIWPSGHSTPVGRKSSALFSSLAFRRGSTSTAASFATSPDSPPTSIGHGPSEPEPSRIGSYKARSPYCSDFAFPFPDAFPSTTPPPTIVRPLSLPPSPVETDDELAASPTTSAFHSPPLHTVDRSHPDYFLPSPSPSFIARGALEHVSYDESNEPHSAFSDWGTSIGGTESRYSLSINLSHVGESTQDLLSATSSRGTSGRPLDDDDDDDVCSSTFRRIDGFELSRADTTTRFLPQDASARTPQSSAQNQGSGQKPTRPAMPRYATHHIALPRPVPLHAAPPEVRPAVLARHAPESLSRQCTAADPGPHVEARPTRVETPARRAIRRRISTGTLPLAF